ncbi:hypothetical protein [Streptomyces adonidis]|uniref:hypothetical protein n=1 Tax=Streptomyces adonidis TaxID=3231367 RepID=UPI0034DB2EE6
MQAPGCEEEVGHGFADGEFGRVDEAVAPHAADAGEDQACGGVDLPDLTVRGHGDLHADLSGGDEELVDDGVDPVPGRMAVGGQKDPVASHQFT